MAWMKSFYFSLCLDIVYITNTFSLFALLLAKSPTQTGDYETGKVCIIYSLCCFSLGMMQSRANSIVSTYIQTSFVLKRGQKRSSSLGMFNLWHVGCNAD